MPPHPELQAKLDSSDVEPPYALRYRAELLAKGVDAPGYSPALRMATKTGDLTTPSEYRVLCLMVEFTDKVAVVDAGNYDSLLFGQQSPSVRHYYQEVSYGQVDVITVDYPSQTGWRTAPQTYAYYCNGASGLGSYPQNCQKLVEDLVALVNPVVDFSDYDNDGDGWVDGLSIIHSGKGAEAESNTALVDHLIWSHKWSISEPLSVDGKLVYVYSMQPEFVLTPGDATIGVYCHEFGHSIFGLPDLYDTDYSSAGLGRWSLMSAGAWNGPGLMGGSPAHPDAWCRVQCGFATANVVSENLTGQAIPSIESSMTGIYRLWSNGGPGAEYFLLENRQRTGYDAYLPGDGLLVYHVDEAVVTDNDNEWYPGHTYAGHYLVALEQADNLYQLDKGQNNGDAGDPFPGSYGRTSFGALTTPNSRDYDGDATLVAIDDITPAGATMFADLTVALAANTQDDDGSTLPEEYGLKQNYPNPFNPHTRIEVELPVSAIVDLAVYNLLGQKVATLLTGTLPAGRQQVQWQAANENGTPLPSGVYLYRLDVNGRSITRKMVLLR
jgi:immune inhibitor A